MEENISKGFDVSRAKDIKYVQAWINWFSGTDTDSYVRSLYGDGEEVEEQKDPNGFKVFHIDSETGYEGGGEECFLVIAIAPESTVFDSHGMSSEVACYLRLEGCYMSYRGTEWEDEWDLVEPKIVPSVVWTDL